MMLFCRLRAFRCHKGLYWRSFSSTRSFPVVNEKISNQLCLRSLDRSAEIGHTNLVRPPLVLFFPWLKAPTKAVEHYCDLYHGRGWDVLTIQGEMQHFLRPRKAVVVAQDIVAFFREHEDRALFVHAMSIGAYLWTILTMELQKDQELLSHLLPMFRGQVFDSIVIGGLGRAGTGIAATFTDNQILRFFITASASLFFAATRRKTVAFYDEAVEAFYANPVKGPVLFFYSLDDPMSDPKSMEHLISRWSQEGTHDVTSKCWTSSPHAGHLRVHREEYLDVLGTFIKKNERQIENH